jgi:hypothetical protein
MKPRPSPANPIKPITPDEARKLKRVTIPDFVIAAFNECIAAHLNKDTEAKVLQTEVADMIRKKGGQKYSMEELIAFGWLDIEPLYRGGRLAGPL